MTYADLYVRFMLLEQRLEMMLARVERIELLARVLIEEMRVHRGL